MRKDQPRWNSAKKCLRRSPLPSVMGATLLIWIASSLNAPSGSKPWATLQLNLNLQWHSGSLKGELRIGLPHISKKSLKGNYHGQHGKNLKPPSKHNSPH